MAPNEYFDKNLAFVHAESDSKKMGFIETTTEHEYYLDRATDQVTQIETVTVLNPYPNARQKFDKKVAGKIVPQSLLSAEIREKIKAIKDTGENI